MAKKPMTDAEKKAWGAKMREARRAKNVTEVKDSVAPPAVDEPKVPEEDESVQVQDEQGLDELRKQMQEVMETNALLKAALLGNQKQGSQGISVGKNNNLLGEVEKYLLDPVNYPDPTPRLRTEARLQPLAFDYNYELDYEVSTSSYETKTGVNMREPKFHVTLNRIVLNDQGEQTPKRYIARKLIFHEDPQAALVIARDNGIDVDKTDENAFLNEMRYLRVRDWLFDIFWPKPAQAADRIKEEVIGGTLVQVFTKNSVENTGVDFDKIKAKVV